MNLVLGAAIDLTGVTLPFTVGDLATSGNSLLALVGSFVLLGLAFAFVPKVIGLIRDAFDNGSVGADGVKRDRHGNRMHFQSAEAKAYRDNFYKEKGWK